jgi:glutamate---cysteine ligase / carboxylate-amine ligase
MEHAFTGPSYTLGIEEELMIVDEETLDLSNSIERLLSDLTDVPTDGEVKPELMEGVCEIATTPVKNTVEAGAQLRSMRRTVNQVAQQNGLAIGSAGTHPYALWEDSRVVARPRYRDLISGLQFVARQELIFGIHVHVGVDDPDKAIHVTNSCSPCPRTRPSGAATTRGWTRPGRRCSAPSRGWASRPATTISPTGRAGSGSWWIRR